MPIHNQNPFIRSLGLPTRAENALLRLDPDLEEATFLRMDLVRTLSRLTNVGPATLAELEKAQRKLWDAKSPASVFDALREKLQEVNSLLMDHPRLRVIVEADGTLTAAMTAQQDADMIQAYRDN